MRRIIRRIVSVATAALLAGAGGVFVGSTAAVADGPDTEKRLLNIVNCSDVTGEIDFSPRLTAVPGIITMAGATSSDSCNGPSGITGYSLEFDATLIGGLCVPATGVILGTLNAGTMTVHWEGGDGASTTDFAWTVPAGLQLGPETSVIAMVGYSQSGRFHDSGTPAIAELTLTLANATPSCTLLSGPNHADFTSGSLLIADAL